MTTNIYQNPEYKKLTKECLIDAVAELDKVSVYNDDKYSKQVHLFYELINTIEE